MKRVLTFLAGFVCISLAHAQNPQFYKDGRNVVNAVTPFLQPGGHTQIMYAPANFNVKPPSGQLTSLFFKNFYLNNINTTLFNTFSITLIQTTDTSFASGNFYTGGTTVINSGLSYYPVQLTSRSADGWLEFALPTAFTYDNTKSLVVDIKYTSRQNDLNSWAEVLPLNNQKVISSTSLTATSGTPSRQWNHFGINVAPTSACTGLPAAGAAYSRRTGSCGNNTYVLDLVGNSTGTSQTYIWQSSSTQTGIYTNVSSSSAVSSFTVSPTTTAWYRAAVTCGGNTSYSTATPLGANGLLPAGTYSINSNKPTGGVNYRSFNSAATALACGIGGPVVFNVAPNCDTFFEQVTFPAVPNTSATNTITINGNAGTLAYRYDDYYNSTYSTSRFVMRLDGTDYLKLDSLNLCRDTAYTYNYSYYFYGNAILNLCNDANNIIVQRCHFGATDTMYNAGTYNNYENAISLTNIVNNGAFASDCDSVLIQNNTFHQGGIFMWGGSPVLSKGNKILNNRFNSEYSNNSYYYAGYGLVYLRSQDSAVVEGNFMNGRSYYTIFDQNDCTNTLISKNVINDTSDYANYAYSKYGIYMYGQGSRAVNNVINLKGGQAIYGILSQNNTGNSLISNNTIRIENVGSNQTSRVGIYVFGINAGQLTVKNNIISMAGIGGGTLSAGIRIYNQPNLTSDNNDIYTPNDNAVIAYTNTTVSYPTLAAWQTASGQDLNSYNLDPSFLSATNLNLRPTNLTIDDKGTPIPGIIDDIAGVSRSLSAPDIGAYEFGNIPYCPPPTSLTASGITTSGATLSWTAPAGNSNFSYVLDQSAANPAISGTATTATTYTASSLAPYTTYYFHVRTNCTNSFSQWVTVSFSTGCLTPSAAITPATPQTVCNNSGVLLAAVSGNGYTYQWKRGGINIPGATTSSYYATVSGSYTVEVTISTCNATTQTPVIVTVLPGASITAAGNTTVCQGGNVALATTATGTYQWQLNNANIPGATNAGYAATASGNYRVIVFSPSCVDTSAPIAVTVVPYPSSTITAAGPTTFCNQQSVRLNAQLNTGYTYQWYRGTTAITGATNYYYDAGVSGSYTVVIGNGSCNITSNAISVTVNPLPAATVSAAGSTGFCQGGSVVLNANAGTGLSYQWQQNGTNLPAATGASFTASNAGVYRVIVSNGICSDTSSGITVNVTAYPSNAITPPGPAAFCENQSIRLNTVLNASYAYQWYRNNVAIGGATSSFYDAGIGGSYRATISNNGCSVTTNDVSVTVYPLPVATADAIGNTVFCNNGAVNIRAGAGPNYSYQWLRNGALIPGATGINYVAGQDGSFSVIVSNGTCTDTSAGVPVVFNAFPRPVIALSNGVLRTTLPFPTYQWNKNGIMIPYANNRDYTPVSDGNYVCVVSDTSGCLGSSNVITINSLGVGSAGTQSISIFPNPATSIVNIRSNQAAVYVSLSAADGKTVLEQRCTTSLDISSLAAGVYTMKITTLTGSLLKIEKLVKVR